MCSFVCAHASSNNSVIINGIENDEISKIVRENIISVYNIDSEEDSTANEYRLIRDKSLIKDVVSSFGYFDALIKARIRGNKTVFEVELGERYKFNDVLIKYVDNPNYRSGITIKEVFDIMRIQINSYTSTRNISEAAVKLEEFLEKRGFAFVFIKAPKIKINSKTKTFQVVFKIRLNNEIVIDKTNVKIDNKKLVPFIKNRIRWKDGHVYNYQEIEDTKEDLLVSGMFASIDVKLSKPVQDPHIKYRSHVQADVVLEEARHNDIAVGAKYGTTEKLGCTIAYTNYNIDCKGSKFSVITDFSKTKQSGKLQYVIHDIFKDQREELKNQVFVVRENANAYSVKKSGAESMLWHELKRNMKIGAGICGEVSQTNDKIVKNPEDIYFKGVGIPIGFSFDTSNTFLDPQKGQRLSIIAIPYACKQNLATINGKFSFYMPMFGNKHNNKIVMAFYTKVGSIIRSSQKSPLPRDKLFFGGGANSVRGYSYQMLGEVNDEKKPFGGESSFEFGIEPRIKVNESFGVALFVEGGNVYSSRFPKITQNLMFGGGFGLRYYTPLGPIRLDLAFPFKRRKTRNNENVDSAFNVYISIGQAF